MRTACGEEVAPGAGCSRSGWCGTRIKLWAVLISLALAMVKGWVGLIGLSETLIADGLFSLYQSFLCGRALLNTGDENSRKGSSPEEDPSFGFIGMVAGFIFLIGIIDVVANSIWRLSQVAQGFVITPRPYAMAAAVISVAGNWLLYEYSACVSQQPKTRSLQALRKSFQLSMGISCITFLSVPLSRYLWAGVDELAAILVAALVAKPVIELFASASRSLGLSSSGEGRVV
jgi:divalent metal cation (Fe/Co/Zn/Cd) transporter